MKPAFLGLLFALAAVAALGCSAAAVPPASDAPISAPPAPAGPVEPGQPTLVLPKPGQHDVHDVAVEQLSAKVAGHHVVLNARWWSGIEPCSVLDSVAATRNGQAITVAVREGSSGAEMMCADIAMLKVTPIDLGDLEPGDYTITASQGPAPGIVVTVN